MLMHTQDFLMMHVYYAWHILMSIDIHDLLPALSLWMQATIMVVSAMSTVWVYRLKFERRVQRRVGFTTRNGARYKGRLSREERDEMLRRIEKRRDKLVQAQHFDATTKMLREGKQERFKCEQAKYTAKMATNKAIKPGLP